MATCGMDARRTAFGCTPRPRDGYEGAPCNLQLCCVVRVTLTYARRVWRQVHSLKEGEAPRPLGLARALILHTCLHTCARRVELLAHGGKLIGDGNGAAQEHAYVVLREVLAHLLADAVPLGPAGVLVVLLAGGDRFQVDLASEVGIQFKHPAQVRVFADAHLISGEG
eukprot:scaffold5720_cov127-Isochrysis_galbana.AAC.2